MEEEFRTLVNQYTDTKTALNALQRKRGTNLNAGPLEEILRPEVIEKATKGKPKNEIFLTGSSFLQTVVVVIKKTDEPEFMNKYVFLKKRDR